MADEQNDISSNPQADGHLPVSGEFDPEGTPSDDNPLLHDADVEIDDLEDDAEENPEDEVFDPNDKPTF